MSKVRKNIQLPFLMLLMLASFSCERMVEDHPLASYDLDCRLYGIIYDTETQDPIKGAVIQCIYSSFYDTLIYTYYSDSLGYYETEHIFKASNCSFDCYKPGEYPVNHFEEDYTNLIDHSTGDIKVNIDIGLSKDELIFEVIPEELFFAAGKNTASMMILNTGEVKLNWRISDSTTTLEFDILSGEIVPGEYQIIRASIDRLRYSSGEIHTSFHINVEGRNVRIPVLIINH